MSCAIYVSLRYNSYKIRFIKSFILFYFCFNSSEAVSYNFEHLKTPKSSADQQKAVIEMIKRILPNRHEEFSIEINSSLGPKDRDTFQIKTVKDNKIKIIGTTGVAASTGFHHYLKYYCNAHISWEGDQLDLPKKLPAADVMKTSNDRFRYYQNVCTTSYSFVWWNWTQWERHIDWMALNSFNLVLAFNGQEAIWERVYTKLYLIQSEIDEHFTGPAFLSWNRMGNIRGWAGPLSKEWHKRSIVLQKQILERMRSFGIIPVLPAFAGHVPRAIKRIYPNATTIKLESWNKFNDTYCCPLLLDPTDPIFKKIGNMFLEELIKEFGTDHVYNCDTFNEMQPFTKNVTYLREIGKSIYSAITDVDPEGIWILQGWMFYSESGYWQPNLVEQFLTSVPLGKMIVLDLQSEQFPQYDRFNSYFGQPFIWCMLHNFGGTLGMLGSVDILNQRPFQARNKINSTMVGMGITPEGINQNYVIYDLMNEMGWQISPVNTDDWFMQYSTRRYGMKDDNTLMAWNILKEDIYNFNGLMKIRGKYAITRSPRTSIKTYQWYETEKLFKAWELFLNASCNLNNSLLYQHDLVDITRQILQTFGDYYYNKIITAFQKKDISDFTVNRRAFLTILQQLDEILVTQQAFLLGAWLNDAKRAASTEDDEISFEYNARNQITLWGPNGEIMDYANKQWSGVVSNFFLPRWTYFLKKMRASLAKSKAFNEPYVVFRMFTLIERPFTFDRKSFTENPTGNSVEVAKNIYDHWKKRKQRS